MQKRIIAYRKGSLDAFIATFIYWKMFKSAIGQVYCSVDPFDKDFVNAKTRVSHLDFLISIGANIKGGSVTRNEKGFNTASGVPPETRFFSYEVNESFPTVESFENWRFFKDESLSLTQLMLKQLEQDGYLNAASSEFKLMHQFFRFKTGDKHVIDSAVADELAILMPNMNPEDFETLDSMLFSPTSAMLKMGRRSAVETIIEQTEAGFTSDWAKACYFDRDNGVDLVTINTTRYTHPSAAKHLSSPGAYVFAYEQVREGVRGKLFAPKGGNALEYFTEGIRSGNESEADYFMKDSFMVNPNGIASVHSV